MSPAGDKPAPDPHGEIHDLETAAALSGMPPEWILKLHGWRLTGIAVTPDPSRVEFDLSSILRLRRIESLRQDCRLGTESLRLVAELLDRLEAAELELRILREKAP